MSLLIQIRSDLKSAMLVKDEVKKSILRVLIGEVDTFEARGKSADNEKIYGIINKIISSNEETLKAKDNVVLVQENTILRTYLPKYLKEEEIYKIFTDNNEIDKIKNSDNEGKAIGLAMKFVKSLSLPVLGDDVRKVVLKVRNGGIWTC